MDILPPEQFVNPLDSSSSSSSSSSFTSSSSPKSKSRRRRRRGGLGSLRKRIGRFFHHSNKKRGGDDGSSCFGGSHKDYAHSSISSVGSTNNSHIAAVKKNAAAAVATFTTSSTAKNMPRTILTTQSLYSGVEDSTDSNALNTASMPFEEKEINNKVHVFEDGTSSTTSSASCGEVSTTAASLLMQVLDEDRTREESPREAEAAIPQAEPAANHAEQPLSLLDPVTTTTARTTEEEEASLPPLSLDAWTKSESGKVCRRLYHTVTGDFAGYPTDLIQSQGDNKNGLLCATTTTTTRFDGLLWQQLESNDETIRAAAATNLDAVTAFANRSTTSDKEFMCREFVHALTSQSALQRKINLEEEEEQARVGSEKARFELAATVLFTETILLKKIGFSVDAYGVCLVMALLKWYATASDLDWMHLSEDRLHQAFLQFWNAVPVEQPEKNWYGDTD